MNFGKEKETKQLKYPEFILALLRIKNKVLRINKLRQNTVVINVTCIDM